MEVWVGRGVVPHDEDVATEAGKGREALGGMEASGVAGDFGDAGRAAHRFGDKLGHRILEVEASAGAFLVVGSLGLQTRYRLSELLLKTFLSLLLLLERLGLGMRMLFEEGRERLPDRSRLAHLAQT